MKGEKSMNVNIRDIYNRTANMSGGRAGVLNGSMLAIGGKGQVVEVLYRKFQIRFPSTLMVLRWQYQRPQYRMPGRAKLEDLRSWMCLKIISC